MKILVTGAAGFIGSYVCKYLLSRGDEVVGLDNINSYYDINLKYGRLLTLGIEENAVNWYLFVESNVYEKFRFIRMNLEDKQAMQMLFANERFDKVVNLAAQAGVRYSIENPYAYVESNIDGFLNVLEGCRHYRVKHLIYASRSMSLDSLFLRPAMSLLKLLGYAVLMAYFGYRGIYLGITAGTMYAFIQYINRLFDPLIEVTQNFSTLQTSMVSAGRVFALIDERT